MTGHRLHVYRSLEFWREHHEWHVRQFGEVAIRVTESFSFPHSLAVVGRDDNRGRFGQSSRG